MKYQPQQAIVILLINNNDLFGIPDNPKFGYSAVNKNYLDNQVSTKADLSKTTTQTFQGRVQVPDFNSWSHAGSDIVNLKYINDTFLNKKSGGTLGNSISFLSSLPSNQRQIFNIGPPQFNSSATSKQYIDSGLNVKLDKTITTNINLNNKQLLNLGFDIKNPSDVVNPGFTDQKYLQKVSDSDLDMDGHRLKNSLEPINSRDLTTKNYVDTEIGIIPQTDTAPYLKIDGTRSMTGDLDMDSYFIRNVGIDLADDSTAILKSYIDARLNNIISYPIIADISFNNHKITNLKTPTGDTDAANKSYIAKTLSDSHLVSSSETNAFVYIDLDDTSSEYNIIVNALTNNFRESPHKNKKAFEITLQKDAGTNNYRSRMGFNLYPLPLEYIR